VKLGPSSDALRGGPHFFATLVTSSPFNPPELGTPVKPGDAAERLTRSVSDGTPVDWQDVEVDADLDADTLHAMRDVARIAEFNRALQRTSDETPPRSSLPASSAPLERWRDLTLLEPIGAGARGEVWRAWDATLQRQVALKFLQPSAPGGGEASADLLIEARALARVRHSSVVTVFGIAEDQGRVGMWMECVPGVTLAREIERVGALPARQVAWIGLQLCSALEAVDAAGLIHRDIKPANILLEGEERVILTDFGLGWRPDLEDETAPKSSGTPMFMAPEVLAGEIPTHQSDLYSLGLTLWWALAGQPPYRAKTLKELRDEVARGPSASLASLQPRAPKELIETILDAMRPSCSERARSAKDLGARFRAIVGDLAPQRISIAVLPFVNRGSGGDDEYFSDGLADELISMLAKIRGLRVAARTSAFSFRGRQVTIGEIGRALNVQTVLDGSVRRSGDRIRISVQLIQVSDGLHLWSESYDRTLNDVFAVQDEIADSVVKELRRALMGDDPAEGRREASAELASASKGRSTHPAAHRLYLIGRHFINRLNREDLTRAIQNLKEAVALDPDFALAWAELGGAYTRAATYGLIPKAEAIQEARDAVGHALTIEPDLAEGHARMAAIQMFHDWDWKGAERSYARALELAPGDSVALNGAGVLAMALGRVEESMALHRRVSEQDPLNVTPHFNLGLSLVRAGRFTEAEAVLRRTLELAPQRFQTRAILGLALASQGRATEALQEVMLEPDEGMRLHVRAIAHHLLGNRPESDAAFHEFAERYGNDYAVQIAEAAAVRGEGEAVFEWLDRAYAQRDFGILEITTNPSFRPFHRDARWGALIRKLLLEPEPARET